MTTKAYFHRAMRILVSVTTSSIQSPQPWTSQYTCCTIWSLFSSKLKFTSVWIPGSSKVSSGIHKAHMCHKLSLSIKNLETFACLCIDFQALNAITIGDSFPLLQIEEALQAVKAAVWFNSFYLVQGYLQMAMDEADIHKTAFHAGSSGLYEFTHMPFGLSNVGASFCCLMELCLWDQ